MRPISNKLLTALLWAVLGASIARLWLAPLDSSFWVDEMVTAFVVRYPAHWSFAIAPQVPASIYYRLPRLTTDLLGSSEIAFRIPSVIAMLIALFLIGRLASRLIHPRAAWFAVFACLSLRWFNYQAIDARPYALGICVAAATLCFMIRWLDLGRWMDAALFIFFGGMLWRVHLIYWPFYLLLVLYVLIRVKSGDTPVTGFRAFQVFALLGLTLAPVIVKALSVLHEAGAHVIIAVPDFRTFQHEIRWSLVAICAGAAWLLGRMFKWSRQERRIQGSSFALVAGWWLCQPVCLYLFSHITGNSVFLDRYLSLALPGLALTATAAAASWIPAKHWRTASLTLGIGVLLVTGRWSIRSPRHDNSNWRAAAAEENQLAIASDTPVICPSPFIEARRPGWTPNYALPGFLYSHLPFYPVKGRPYLFPFEPADGKELAGQITGSISQTPRFMIYGGDRNVMYWRDWFEGQPALKHWNVRLERFGDVALAVFDKPA